MSAFRRPEDVLREMRAAVVSVDDEAVAEARRRNIVARMRTAQRAGLVQRADRTRWRRRIATIGFLLVPSGALAAAWLVAAHGAPIAAHANEPKAPKPSRHVASPAAFAAAIVPSVAPSHATENAAPEPASDEPRALTHESSLRREQRAAPVVAAAPRSATADFPPGSTLAIENALMQSAMSATRTRDDARAVVLFDELLNRYPGSPLAASARVERQRAVARRDGTNDESGTATP